MMYAILGAVGVILIEALIPKTTAKLLTQVAAGEKWVWEKIKKLFKH